VLFRSDTPSSRPGTLHPRNDSSHHGLDTARSIAIGIYDKNAQTYEHNLITSFFWKERNSPRQYISYASVSTRIRFPSALPYGRRD